MALPGTHYTTPNWFDHDCRLCLHMPMLVMREAGYETYSMKGAGIQVVELPDGSYGHANHTRAQYDNYVNYLRNLPAETRARLGLPF